MIFSPGKLNTAKASKIERKKEEEIEIDVKWNE